ncbi:tubulin polyglutamylase complex subunit 2 [Ischnura elegans]|uniref:tubulin polyglutamylase complex subunit 2 n=1 Tax=Ischnura elegans TaxID=197161 RepID=UPI001ED8980C|nr:tubulin polyglutamylase complex subunit 2 [Ischnura elegans]
MDASIESSFYENLTLGLVKLLEETPGVQGVELEKRSPCDRQLMNAWEQRYSCVLPEDLKHFYLSIDGFRLIWNYEYAGEVLAIGNMKINSLSELRRIGGLKPAPEGDGPTLLDIEMCSQGASGGMDDPQSPQTVTPQPQLPNFGVKCKIFELDPCQGLGKVCLVYHDRAPAESGQMSGALSGLQLPSSSSFTCREEPKIWLLDRCFEWHFLAHDFTHYFRMMLVHQGLPQWQFRFTPMGLTPWAEQMFAMIAPHLLQSDLSHLSENADWGGRNPCQLDPSVFKTRTKSSKREKK